MRAASTMQGRTRQHLVPPDTEPHHLDRIELELGSTCSHTLARYGGHSRHTRHDDAARRYSYSTDPLALPASLCHRAYTCTLPTAPAFALSLSFSFGLITHDDLGRCTPLTTSAGPAAQDRSLGETSGPCTLLAESGTSALGSL